MTDKEQIDNYERRPAVPAGAYINRMARRLVWRYWWLPAIGVAVAVVGLLTDVRWAIVGLVVLLMIFPPVMMIVVMDCASRPDIVARMYVASASVAEDGIVCFYDDCGRELVTIASGRGRIAGRKSTSATIVFGPRASDIIIVPTKMLDDAGVEHFDDMVEM